jgi:hypothetical protein
MVEVPPTALYRIGVLFVPAPVDQTVTSELERP